MMRDKGFFSESLRVITKLSPSLPLSDNPQDEAQRLHGLLRIIAAALTACAIMVFAIAQFYQAEALFWYGVLLAGYTSLLLWAHHQLEGNNIGRAILAVSGGMLVCCAISVVLVPETASAATLVPLLAVGIALPDLKRRMLRLFMIVSWLATGLVVISAETLHVFPALPHSLAALLHLQVLAVAPLIYWLLWQHHLRLTRLLKGAQQANQVLQQAHLALEEQVYERKQREEELRRAEIKYRSLVEHIPAIIYVLDRSEQNTTVYISPQVQAALGLARSEWQGRPEEWFRQLLPHAWVANRLMFSQCQTPLDLQPLEFHILTHDGRIVWFRDEVTLVNDEAGLPAYLHGIMTDITQRKHAEEQLLRLALYDPLTELPNRTLFMDRLDQAFLRSQRDSSFQFAILFLDLDRFKNINDSLGHRVGDELLVSIARRLQHCLRATDTVSRLGGDEFAILLTVLKDVDDAICVAERIQQELAAPFDVQGHAIFTTISIGVALNSTLSYAHMDEILRDADTAMYQAKGRGRAGYVLFDPAMHVSAVARLRLERDLRFALERDEFLLYYQPQIDLNTGRIFGVEALIRWQHPEHGLIAPADFIPIAEETGLIVPIGEWGLRAACNQAKLWHAEGATGLKVAVNLSAKQFRHHSLPTLVASILAETGLEPHCLEIELIESDAMEDADASVGMLRQLKKLGVGIAIDDFGTGYSSLSYLQRFPIDVVKIDRSFVQYSSTDAGAWAITRTIIAMAHSLRLHVVAEGVETEEQRDFLLSQGCYMAQGYLFSRAVPAEQISQLLQVNSSLLVTPSS